MSFKNNTFSHPRRKKDLQVFIFSDYVKNSKIRKKINTSVCFILNNIKKKIDYHEDFNNSY